MCEADYAGIIIILQICSLNSGCALLGNRHYLSSIMYDIPYRYVGHPKFPNVVFRCLSFIGFNVIYVPRYVPLGMYILVLSSSKSECTQY